MDEARKQTDKKLKDVERRVSDVYATDPSLLRIRDKYERYMERVARLTKDSYTAYKNAPEGEKKDELKKAYISDVERLTSKNAQYKNIISEFTRIMAQVNQKALDLVNAEMPEVYRINYNQVAKQCEEVGITVNGQAEL